MLFPLAEKTSERRSNCSLIGSPDDYGVPYPAQPLRMPDWANMSLAAMKLQRRSQPSYHWRGDLTGTVSLSKCVNMLCTGSGVYFHFKELEKHYHFIFKGKISFAFDSVVICFKWIGDFKLNKKKKHFSSYYP